MNKNLKVLSEGAIMTALSAVLSLIPVIDMPFGGKVTLLSSLPIMVFIYRRGAAAGFSAAFLFSIVQFIMGLDNLAYATDFPSLAAIVLGDYILPYTLYGTVSLMRNIKIKKNDRLNNSVSLSLGVIFAFLLRFLCHLVSGGVVWYSLTKVWYADDPSNIVFRLSPFAYSAVYNSVYLIPEMLLTVAAAAALCFFVNPKSENLLYRTGRD